MTHVIELTDAQWKFVADLLDPPGRRGAPAQIPRRQMGYGNAPPAQAD